MSLALPDHLDPWHAVRAGLAFAGEVALTRMPRLASLVVPGDRESETRISYRLRFGRDQEGRAVVEGQVGARLRQVCQRCLEEVMFEIHAPLRLGLVHAGEAAGLPEELDPLVVGSEPLRPLDLIEDELLLAIPAVPRHVPGRCQAPSASGLREVPRAGMSDGSGSAGRVAPVAASDPSGRPHPFAVLAALKGDRSD